MAFIHFKHLAVNIMDIYKYDLKIVSEILSGWLTIGNYLVLK